MKREVERELSLPAFGLERGDLKLLWQRVLGLFDSATPVASTLALTLPNERLTFESIAEMNSYVNLRGRVTRFTLEVRQAGRSVQIKSGGIFSTTPTLKVAGESDIWCAGAIEAVMHVVQTRRTWYFWFARLPYFPASMFCAALPWLKLGPFATFPQVSPWLTLSWLFTTVLLIYLSLFHERVLPRASITFTKELGFLRRYAGEIGLLLGVLSIALSIYMWVKPYGA